MGTKDMYFIYGMLLGFIAVPGAFAKLEYTDTVNHPCVRECQDGAAPLTCEYNFTVEWYFVLSKACYDCPFNASHCDLPHCVPADGAMRAVMTVNRQIPGPDIQVCENDTIIVNVYNKMQVSEGTSIHWHGFHQRGTPYMDGVAMLTQCPIPAHGTFQYKFYAHNPGTYFWHAHAGLQRADGVFGNLVVRQSPKNEPHHGLYDYDKPEHVILITDWLAELSVNKFAAHHHRDGDNKPKSILINGKGAFREHIKKDTNESAYTPYAVFNVKNGYSYRFRMSNNGILYCPIQISVDGHNLTMISTDGTPFEPIEVETFIIMAGERFDFIINATKPVGNYWIRAQGLADCGPQFSKAKQAAILRYEGAKEEHPVGSTEYEDMGRTGRLLNPWNTKASEDNIPVTELHSLYPNDVTSKKDPDVQYYLAFEFNKIDNYHFHHPDYYPINAIERNKHLYSPLINDIALMMPPAPPLSQFSDVPKEALCDHTTHNETYCQSQDLCECTYTINIDLGQMVEIVLVDKGVTFAANHPMHLHGQHFSVVALQKLGTSVTVDQVKEMDKAGNITRKLDRPVRKDTVTVPDGGFTIIRFHATNPGLWFFHCHLEFHVEVGMGLVFKVGEPKQWPPVPYNFPRCGSWKMQEPPPPPPPQDSPEVTCPKGSTSKANQMESINMLLSTALFITAFSYV